MGHINFTHFNLLLGIVDKLITEVERGVLTSRKAGKKFMDNFLKKVKSSMVIAVTQNVDTFIFFHIHSLDDFLFLCGWKDLFDTRYDLTLFGIGEHCKEILRGRALT